MRQAFRGHYQPASIELIPGADPYIAELVVGALARVNHSENPPTFSGRAVAPVSAATSRFGRQLPKPVPYRSW